MMNSPTLCTLLHKYDSARDKRSLGHLQRIASSRLGWDEVCGHVLEDTV